MIAVIADDLSGAAEIAGAARRRGLRAEVQTEFDPRTDAEVICIDIDTRSRSAAEAAQAAGAMAARLAKVRPEWIYQKCDSVLRGQVLAEVRAIMAATGQERALLVPANPARRRVIRGGHLFVEDLPLHETAFARDPGHPRTTSRLSDLLGGDLSGVAAPDADCAEDMIRHAALVDDGTLAAGGVEFFEALLTQRGFVDAPGTLHPDGPGGGTPGLTLVVCGSAAAWTQRREQAAAANTPAFSLPLEAAEIANALRSHRRVLIGIGDGPATVGVEPSILLGNLAQTSAAVAREVAVTRMLLEGGATAAAVVRELGWTRLGACEPAAPGIGTLRPVHAASPILSIKPGSYDWPAELWT